MHLLADQVRFDIIGRPRDWRKKVASQSTRDCGFFGPSLVLISQSSSSDFARILASVDWTLYVHLAGRAPRPCMHMWWAARAGLCTHVWRAMRNGLCTHIWRAAHLRCARRTLFSAIGTLARQIWDPLQCCRPARVIGRAFCRCEPLFGKVLRRILRFFVKASFTVLNLLAILFDSTSYCIPSSSWHYHQVCGCDVLCRADTKFDMMEMEKWMGVSYPFFIFLQSLLFFFACLIRSLKFDGLRLTLDLMFFGWFPNTFIMIVKDFSRFKAGEGVGGWGVNFTRDKHAQTQ